MYASGETVTGIRIWKGDTERIAMGLERDLYVTVPRGRYGDIDAKMELAARLLAPVRAGEQHGVLRLAMGEELTIDGP